MVNIHAQDNRPWVEEEFKDVPRGKTDGFFFISTALSLPSLYFIFSMSLMIRISMSRATSSHFMQMFLASFYLPMVT